MSSDNWYRRQPGHVRLFLLVTLLAALALFLVLLVVLRNTAAWVPEDAVATDTLIPPAADSGRHFTPDTLLPRPITAVTPIGLPAPGTLRWRVGVAVPDPSALYYDWPATRPGWYLNWFVAPERNVPQPPALSGSYPELGMEFAPMVTMRNGRLYPDSSVIQEVAKANPGMLWLIGNEPDVKWQDNTAPEIYAIAYARAYKAIKESDPTAQVAIGGLSEITPLRLDYLDRVWDFYKALYGEEMPVDIWNMHAFVLREERDSWGVNIPPGFEVEQRGMMWEVDDHDNLTLIEQQIRRMRRWMVNHGQQEKPLIISEYGILMPEEYGFSPERVSAFLRDSFDLFRTLRDPALGDPADDYRLVQRWVWYPARDSRYRAGSLFDDNGELTAVGQTLVDYLNTYAE